MSVEAIGLSWFLQMPGATYALGVNPEGFLEHWHWGAPMRAQGLGTLRPRVPRAFQATTAGVKDPAFALDLLPGEYPFAGSGDFRPAAVEVEDAEGARVLSLRYRGHEIRRGKPGLPGLPATYVEKRGEADTLQVRLGDEAGEIEVVLVYTVFRDHAALARSARIENRGSRPVRILRALSASVDFTETADWRWLHLSGTWARERQVEIAALRPGLQAVESRRGASSHQHNPFLALLAPGADEVGGEVRGFSLVYSGNFHAGVELDAFGGTRAQIGLNPAGFSWVLEPGENFQTPEAVLVYSGEGLGGMSRVYHRLYRTRLCRGHWRDRPRPVLINNWEATWFDFDERRLLDLARRARRLGVELFVLDDGWFGRRDDDRSSLGDWHEHPRRLPRGLEGLVRKLDRLGLGFGLWFEPEMVSPDSDLYRAHPDWCLHVPGRSRSPARSQLVLDFSRPEVVEAIYARMAAVLRRVPVRYVKWDMNRHLTEVASAGRAPARQAETAHRHILGLYWFLERLTREFPRILFENCSGGGGRFDPGMLHYMPQTWTSDNTDAVDRLGIQHGTSLVYPLSSMGAHVSCVPNHLTGRTTPLLTRALAATTGAFGLELDLAKCSRDDLAGLRDHITRYRRWRRLLATGELHRLKDPAGGAAAWMVVSADAREALVFHVGILGAGNGSRQRLRLRGLRAEWRYRDRASGVVWGGDALMAHGLAWAGTGDFAARWWHLRRTAARA